MPIVDLLLIGLCASSVADSEPRQLTKTCEVRFATLEQGQAAIRRRDPFIRSLSRFDKQSRLKTDKEVTTDAFLKFAASHVRAWKLEDQRKLTRVIERIRPKLREFPLELPEVILLVHTTGQEEGGAAYCRGNAIVLPSAVVARTEKRLTRLLTHELFHVLSSSNPKLREELYAIIGFHPCGQVDLPPPLIDRKITNPDAPEISYAISLPNGDASQHAVPILYASVKRYDPASGHAFFRFLTFRLMVVEKKGNRFQPKLRDGQPELIDAAKLPAYLDQIGRNTSYVIHPEEVLADNFVHLVQSAERLATPHIVEQMRRLLKREPRK